MPTKSLQEFVNQKDFHISIHPAIVVSLVVSEILAVMEEWCKDNWIPNPTHDDSFWQNRLINDLRNKIKQYIGGAK